MRNDVRQTESRIFCLSDWRPVIFPQRGGARGLNAPVRQCREEHNQALEKRNALIGRIEHTCGTMWRGARPGAWGRTHSRRKDWTSHCHADIAALREEKTGHLDAWRKWVNFFPTRQIRWYQSFSVTWVCGYCRALWKGWVSWMLERSDWGFKKGSTLVPRAVRPSDMLFSQTFVREKGPSKAWEKSAKKFFRKRTRWLQGQSNPVACEHLRSLQSIRFVWMVVRAFWKIRFDWLWELCDRCRSYGSWNKKVQKH